jgi:hypothetical protein
LQDFFFSPLEVINESGTNAVVAPYVRLNGTYADVYTNSFANFLRAQLPENGYVLCDRVDENLIVQSVASGNILLGGNTLPLKRAAELYTKLYEGVNSGANSNDELERALSDKSAISIEQIDSVVDSAIEYAKSVSLEGDTSESNIDTTTALEACRESVVLLKNDNVLPLEGKMSVAVIGDIAQKYGVVDKFGEVEDWTFVGFARGYDLDKVRSDSLLKQATELADTADVVFLFLGLNDDKLSKMDKKHSVKLPANQLALASHLAKLSAKVVVIVEGNEYGVDMGFDENLNAVLLTDLNTPLSADALIDIISGKVNPSGVLAQAYYEDTDSLFARICADKNSGKNKVGGFLGYRYFDSSHLPVKYPFGYGLSYTQFEYNNLVVTPSGVSVTVKNIGEREGCEVVQFYVGKYKSAIIRPRKELKNFVKISLKAGESKTVRFPIIPSLMAVYDSATNKKIVEGGLYKVYICSSSQDVKLQAKIIIKGQPFEKSEEKLSDYLQSESNIKEQGYTLSDVKSRKNSGKRRKIVGGALGVISLVGVLVFVALHVGGVISLSKQLNWLIFMCVLCGVFVVAVNVLLVGFLASKHAKEHASIVVKKSSSEEEPEESKTYERLFEEQFGKEVGGDNFIEVQVGGETQEEENDVGLEQSVLSGMTLELVCNWLVDCLKDFGVIVTDDGARKIISCVATSRLILLRNKSKDASKKLVQALAGFFGGDSYITIPDHCENLQQLFYYTSEEGAREKSAFNLAIEHCPEGKNKGYFSAIDVVPEDLNNILPPFTKYAESPYAQNIVVCGEEGFVLPSNLWIVALLDDKSVINTIDANILKSATLLDVDIKLAEENESKDGCASITVDTFEYLAQNAKDKYFLDESLWKKVDAVEEYCSTLTYYHLDNKKWQRLEKYSSVYLSCGGEAMQAFDNMLTSEVMYWAMKQVQGAKSVKAADFKGAIDKILGEDDCPECKNAIKIFKLK